MITWQQIRYRYQVVGHLREDGRIVFEEGKTTRDELIDYVEEGPPKSAFDGLTYDHMLHNWYSVGKKTIRELEMWLGIEFPKRAKRTAGFSPATLEKYADVLRKHGYSVSEPTKKENQRWSNQP